jgi:hypothetical protein
MRRLSFRRRRKRLCPQSAKKKLFQSSHAARSCAYTSVAAGGGLGWQYCGVRVLHVTEEAVRTIRCLRSALTSLSVCKSDTDK